MDSLSLDHAVFQTIRYFDIFDLPITATQIWQTLVVERSAGARWGGHRQYRLADIQDILDNSSWLQDRIGSKWGYYFLSGRDDLVQKRLHRHSIAQDKWRLTKKAAKWLAAVPFVRGLAGSGSLAIDNVSPSSDLDFLIIAHPTRIWTTRLGLLAVSQLIGRRRKHWDQEAPDKVCLNHYISWQQLSLPKELHNIYTAVQYSLLVPVYAADIVREFQEANGSWIRRHVMSYQGFNLGHRNQVSVPTVLLWMKRALESILLEPIGDAFEHMAERLQRAVIRQHSSGQTGRIALSAQELAFHPDTKAPNIIAAFQQDPGQKQLL